FVTGFFSSNSQRPIHSTQRQVAQIYSGHSQALHHASFRQRSQFLARFQSPPFQHFEQHGIHWYIMREQMRQRNRTQLFGSVPQQRERHAWIMPRQQDRRIRVRRDTQIGS